MKSHALVNTILGPASQVGTVHGGSVVRVAGSLHISGDVCADVVAEGSVVISADARVQGNVTAVSVIVGGIVLGDIAAAEKVTMLSTSVVLGNVTTGCIRIDDGAVLSGRVSNQIGGAEQPAAPKNEVMESKLEAKHHANVAGGGV